MSTRTANHGFYKPSLSDFANIEDMNENWDKIDELLVVLQTAAMTAQDDSLHEELTRLIDAKANKPDYVSYIITANGWTGDTAPYTYTISGYDGKQVNVYEDGALTTAEQLEALAAANIKGSPTSEANILYAFGKKPTIDIHVALGVQ